MTAATQSAANEVIDFWWMGTISTDCSDNGLITARVEDHAWRGGLRYVGCVKNPEPEASVYYIQRSFEALLTFPWVGSARRM